MSHCCSAAGPTFHEALAIVAEVRSGRRSGDELVPLLAEEAALYAGLGTGEAERFRGHVLASFANSGLPDAALPYVFEELETGRNAFTVAAAARALRASPQIPSGAASLLERAMRRIRRRNQYVDFDQWLPVAPAAGARTALEEIEEAHAEIRARPCCKHGDGPDSPIVPVDVRRALETEVEDQDGEILSLGDLVRGKGALLTFFYTRCMNPQKCSLTVSKLARVWSLVEAAGLTERVAAAGISYDPGFDLPHRLHEYGAARGLRFERNCRLLRTTGPFQTLRDRLSLGVGYGDATVNRHRLELIILNPDASLAEYRTRRLWDETHIFETLRRTVSQAAPMPGPDASA